MTTEAGKQAAPPHQPLRIFGEAAGYLVALIQDDAVAHWPTLQVAVGRIGADTIEPVAILPVTLEGASDADIIGTAILRTLQLIEDETDPLTVA